MAATTEHHEAEVEHPDHDANRQRTYVLIAVVLAAITAAEVATFYFDDLLGGEGSLTFAIVLIAMMAVKFWMVASWFMHLRYDKRLLAGVFYSGLVLALLVYIAVLAMFRFFGGDMDVPGELFGTSG
jgi:cytochrome c oxidase subunit 4